MEAHNPVAREIRRSRRCKTEQRNTRGEMQKPEAGRRHIYAYMSNAGRGSLPASGKTQKSCETQAASPLLPAKNLSKQHELPTCISAKGSSRRCWWVRGQGHRRPKPWRAPYVYEGSTYGGVGEVQCPRGASSAGWGQVRGSRSFPLGINAAGLLLPPRHERPPPGKARLDSYLQVLCRQTFMTPGIHDRPRVTKEPRRWAVFMSHACLASSMQARYGESRHRVGSSHTGIVGSREETSKGPHFSSRKKRCKVVSRWVLLHGKGCDGRFVSSQNREKGRDHLHAFAAIHFDGHNQVFPRHDSALKCPNR